MGRAHSLALIVCHQGCFDEIPHRKYRSQDLADDDILDAMAVVPVGATTADRYSRIAASLRAKGRRVLTNDLWIAAHAMETGADLVSAAGHFEHVDGIAWIRLKGERRPAWPTV